MVPNLTAFPLLPGARAHCISVGRSAAQRCSPLVHRRHRPRRKVVGGTAKVRIEALQAELAKLEAVAGGHRADFERERDRADRLMAER